MDGAIAVLASYRSSNRPISNALGLGEADLPWCDVQEPVVFDALSVDQPYFPYRMVVGVQAKCLRVDPNNAAHHAAPWSAVAVTVAPGS